MGRKKTEVITTYKGFEIIHAAAGIAGKDVKPDVWYELNSSGEFVEVES